MPKLNRKNKSRSTKVKQSDPRLLPWGGRMALVGVALSLAILSGVQLILANNLATEGEQIREMEGRWMELEAERRVLEEELVQLGSLGRVREEAEEALGMRANTGQVDYLAPPVLAVRP